MTTTNYINSDGLRLMVKQLPSGSFDLDFGYGCILSCYSQEELQDFLQRNNFQKR